MAGKRGAREDNLKLAPQERLYFAAENKDFTFTQEEVKSAIKLWNDGVDIRDAAIELGGRHEIEIFVLWYDLKEKKRLKHNVERNGIYALGRNNDG